MEAWSDYSPRSTVSESNKARSPGLLGIAGLCAALWAVLLTNVVDKGVPRAWYATAGPGDATTAAQPLDVLIRVGAIDTARLAASLNITLRGLPAAVMHDDDAILSVQIGGATHSLDLVAGAAGNQRQNQHTAFQATARLTEVVASQLRPFDAYRLSLGPVSAMLRTCSKGSSSGSATQQQAEEERDCLTVALPMRLVLEGGKSAQGFKLMPRAAAPSAAAAAAGPSAAAAAEEDLLITRSTSQRVLRLMALMLQWLFTTYAVAWGAGAVVGQWLLCRYLGGRMHYVL